MDFAGAIRSEFKWYLEFFDNKIERPLITMDIGKFRVSREDKKGKNAQWQWLWNPGEDDLINTGAIITWLRSDNQAANYVAKLEEHEIDSLPSNVKAALIANIRDAAFFSGHEENILELLGLIDGKTTEINQEIWLIIQEAYALDHKGEKPSGYSDVYNWLHSKMNSDHKEIMDDGLDDESYFDLIIEAGIPGEDSSGNPIINLKNLNTKELGGKILPEDKQYIIGLTKNKDFDTPFSGLVECPSGKKIHVPVTVNFAEGKFTILAKNINSTVPNYSKAAISTGLDYSKVNF